MMKNDVSFETALVELEDVVNKLESGKISLEESISLYKKSVELYKICNKFLEDAKQTIEIIKNENYESVDINVDVLTEK